MAQYNAVGLDEINSMFKDLSTIPDAVLEEALTSMGKVAMGKVKAVGEAMHVRDPESDTHILDNIGLSPFKRTDTGAVVYVTFKGGRKRRKGSANPTYTSNAEIAFVNEFGRRGQPARPFVKTATEQYADAIAAPGEKIVGDWFEKTVQN